MTAVEASFSLLFERGGRDINKISRSLLLWGGRGGDQIPTYFLVVIDHHPVCAAEDAAQLFS
jgi:hypothetical protein